MAEKKPKKVGIRNLPRQTSIEAFHAGKPVSPATATAAVKKELKASRMW